MEIMLVAAEPETRSRSLGSFSIKQSENNACSICFSVLCGVISGNLKELHKSR
jgi:hypothetical protein